MNRFIFLASVLLTSSLSLTAQTARIEDGQVMLGAVDSLYSETLKEQRNFWVYVPQSAQQTYEKLPVLYLLDGNAHFYSVAGMLRQLAEVNGNTIAPETIIVAIPNTNRVRDLTPSAVQYIPNSGGAEQFMAFLEKELIPYVEEKYQASSYRSLVGHSWGALFVLNALITNPDLFQNYVSIDPSIRWNNMAFLEKAKSALATENFAGKSLFLGVANRLPKGLNLNTVEADTNKNSEHMRKMLEFVEAAEHPNSLNFQWQFYPDDHHLSVPLIATYDAIRFLYPWYSFNEEILFDGSLQLNAWQLVELVESHFQIISEQFGYKVKPTERLVNRLGDVSLSIQDFEMAQAMYQLNITNYPESADVYDAMGDFHVRKGEKEKAKAAYRTSLELEETGRTRRKLSRLLQ